MGLLDSVVGMLGAAHGGFASEHDAKVAGKLAYVLTGGDLSGPTWVDPWYILDLEREAFLSLLGEESLPHVRVEPLVATGRLTASTDESVMRDAVSGGLCSPRRFSRWS